MSEVTLDLQDLRAALADDDCVGVRENGGDGEASRALDVHEERAGGRDEGLELVLAGLTGCMLVQGPGCGSKGGSSVRGGGGVEKVNGENLGSCQHASSIEIVCVRRWPQSWAVKILWQSPRLSCAGDTESHRTLSAASRRSSLTILSVYGEFSV